MFLETVCIHPPSRSTLRREILAMPRPTPGQVHSPGLRTKCDAAYQHVFDSYWDDGNSLRVRESRLIGGDPTLNRPHRSGAPAISRCQTLSKRTGRWAGPQIPKVAGFHVTSP